MTSSSNKNSSPPSFPKREAAAYTALSQIVLDARPLDQTLGEVAVLAQRALPESPQVSVTLLSVHGPHTAGFSGRTALQLDERQYANGSGPCLDAAATGSIIEVAMQDPSAPYPDFRQSAQKEGITHSLSVGMRVAGHTNGALNFYTSLGTAFTASSARIAATFAGFAGTALATIGRRDAVAAVTRLQQAIASRVTVSQAIGMLIAKLHYSPDEAFAMLIGLSQRHDVPLRDAAQALVDRDPGPAAGRSG